ncbi:MAG: sigma-70 family RNA polymerase sigma factor [Myxococcales bacterium]|nr:sigma-70 family RNA polymerase sigma factor [Myxococcales bacterium]
MATPRPRILRGLDGGARAPGAGPAPSFDAVYAEHFDFVWRCAAHRGVPTAALDDVTQEVFIIVHRKLPEFEGRAQLRTWIGAIVRRVTADYLRRRGNRPAADESLEREPADLASGDDPVDRREALRVLDSVLAKMPEDQREVFVLRELEDLSGGEIAAITGANENTVWTRLRAARRRFREGVAIERARRRWRQPR